MNLTYTINYCKRRNVEKKKKILLLEEQINQMDKDINSNKGDKHILYCKKRDLQSELEIALRFQASQIRSRSEYIEEGKTKYLILFKFGKATTNK